MAAKRKNSTSAPRRSVRKARRPVKAAKRAANLHADGASASIRNAPALNRVVFLSRAAVEALHRESLAEHGGLDGLRDEGLLESVLGRCRNKAAYEPESTPIQLAASLAFGLAKNRAFHEGNKRIALIASFTFLALNRIRVIASEKDAYDAIYALAAGRMSEDDLASWFARNTKMIRGKIRR